MTVETHMLLEKPRCPHCGQTTHSTYTVSRGLRDSLRAMARFIEKKGIDTVHFQKELVAGGWWTPSQERNMCTHGVYTGLVAHTDEPGNYVITKRGWDFLNGEPVPKHTFVKKRTGSKNTHVVEVSEETCTASDFNKKGEYWEVLGFQIKSGKVVGRNDIIEV